MPIKIEIIEPFTNGPVYSQESDFRSRDIVFSNYRKAAFILAAVMHIVI